MYWLAVRLASPFNKKARLLLQGQKQTFAPGYPQNTKRIWFHCASLGEFEQAKPVLQRIKQKWPNTYIMVSFFSPSGYNHAQNAQHTDLIVYLPKDNPKNAKRFIDLIKPDIALFVKYEIWPFYFLELKKRGIPLYMVSVIFRPQQLYFKNWARFFHKTLSAVSHFFVQNQQTETILQKAGFNNTTLCGDTRYDRVLEVKSTPFSWQTAFLSFQKNHPVLAAGSPWVEDLQVLKASVGALKNEKGQPVKWIIAPHYVDKGTIEKFQVALSENIDPEKIILFSKISTDQDLSDYQVILVDEIGQLSKLYRYADVAYIGGGFSGGLHNTLEAVVYGIPLIVGPKNQKFQEVKLLKQQQLAFEIHSKDEFFNVANGLFENAKKLETLKHKAKGFVQTQTGASDTIVHFLENSNL